MHKKQKFIFKTSNAGIKVYQGYLGPIDMATKILKKLKLILESQGYNITEYETIEED